MQNTLSHQTEEYSDELESDTLLLLGQYQIESYLIRGGFGITYLARDSLDRRVVIKECFPNSICCRFEGQVQAKSRDQQHQFKSVLRHFLREARRLARLSHPNIVGVHQVFEENGTAYMALDFVDGMDLLSVIEEEPDRLNPDMIRSMLIKSLGAINYIHGKGILHRDISPDNFLLDGAENLTLIDFGAAREHASRESRMLSSLLAVKDGYSPQEFYLRDVSQYPSSDLYALGATFYHLITGEAPPNSQQRLAAVASDEADPFQPLVISGADYDADFLEAINKVLEIFPEDRIQTAQDWVEAIDSERRRQAAVAGAGKDMTIRLKISRLVAETNQSLDGPVPEPIEDSAMVEEAPVVLSPANIAPAKGEKVISQPVDLFGDPIDDVEAWLWEQDRAVAKSSEARAPKRARKPKPKPKRTPRPKSTPAAAAKLTSPDPEPQRPRFLRSLMGRLAPSGLYPPRNS